jgi:tRNA G18 (ribose-2'-O)-methylase SpoU
LVIDLFVLSRQETLTVVRIRVASIDDPRLQPYRNIRHRDPAGFGKSFIAEGRELVEQLINSRYRCESVLVQGGTHPDLVDFLAKDAASPDILIAEPALLKSVVGFDFHRGVLAHGIGEQLPTAVPDSGNPGENRLGQVVLAVCGVNNPENIGGLLRTAAALGIADVMVTAGTANPFSRRALRVSMAASLRLNLYRLVDPTTDLAWLAQRCGYRIMATTPASTGTPVKQIAQDLRDNPGPYLVMVGPEWEGLEPSFATAATDWITIPMQQGTDSLNVTVATAIVLWELTGR